MFFKFLFLISFHGITPAIAKNFRRYNPNIRYLRSRKNHKFSIFGEQSKCFFAKSQKENANDLSFTKKISIFAPAKPQKVPWPSGQAPVCKTDYGGSNPPGTSFIAEYMFFRQLQNQTFIFLILYDTDERRIDKITEEEELKESIRNKTTHQGTTQ